MIEVLTKPLEQIDRTDIEKLISDRVPEGEHIEFKKTLPTHEKNCDDPWIDGKDKFGNSAKNKILEEVIAFANAHGGALLLGIDESRSKPPVASRLNPIPKCIELAERFKLVFRDCVEPNLTRIEIRGIPIKNDAGIVIFRVGRSPLSPHRITKTLNCPVRRSDRCEKLTMREIQDMTLNVARGHKKIDRKFAKRSERFQSDFQLLKSPDYAFGIRVTAIPVIDEIRLEKVFDANQVLSEFSKPNVKVFRQIHTSRNELDGIAGHHNLRPYFWRPILRGTRAEHNHDHRSDILRNCYWEIHCDGLVEIGFISTREFSHSKSGNSIKLDLPTDLPIVEFSNLIVWANKIRNQILVPASEYAIEAEFKVLGDKKTGGLNDLDTYSDFNVIDKMQNGSTIFPRYALGDFDFFPQLVALFERDFWHSFGKDIGNQQGTLIIQSI